MQLNLNKKLVDLSTPLIMGIVNVTPDSFFKGNRFVSDKGILQCVEKIIVQGGQIIDIGGYSTRPIADEVTQDEEIKRVSEALALILKKFPDLIISVDTFRSSVVRQVVKNFPVAMINDIGGGTLDNLMFETIADLQVAYIMMHTRGTPQTMQTHTQYDNVVSEVLFFLEKRLAQLRLLGVKDVIIDPGFGFAKTIDQNFQLLNQLSYLKELNVPILAGISRKSMIYNTLETSAEGALNGTTAANMLALMGGANILRVHDVKEAKETITIFEKCCKSSIGKSMSFR
ncbi:MAG: dihydropteroate synthase [Paludibacter sp.]